MIDVKAERILFVSGPHKGKLGYLREYRDYHWVVIDFDGNLIHECNGWTEQSFEDFEADETKWTNANQFIDVTLDKESERRVSEIEQVLWSKLNKEQPIGTMTEDEFQEALAAKIRDIRGRQNEQ